MYHNDEDWAITREWVHVLLAGHCSNPSQYGRFGKKIAAKLLHTNAHIPPPPYMNNVLLSSPSLSRTMRVIIEHPHSNCPAVYCNQQFQILVKPALTVAHFL